MAETSLASLIVSETKAAILQKLFDACNAWGLDVESWQSGDPTRSILDAIAARWSEFEDADKGFPAMVKGVLLGLSTGAWLTELAKRRYNVTRPTATYATCTVRFVNTTPQDWGTFAVDDVTVRNPATEAQFRNAAIFALGPNATVDVSVQATVAGSSSNSDIGDITALVTSMPGVTVTNTTAAVGRDEMNDDGVTALCQAKLEALSPAGPRGAYEFMLKTPEFQSDGATNVTRVRVVEDSDYGDAVVFIAGASGALIAADQTKGYETLDAWANPFCVNDVLLLASNKSVAITYKLWVYDSINKTTSEVETIVGSYLAERFAARDIGGDDAVPPTTVGKIYREWIRAQILQAVAPHGYRCDLTLPVSDVDVDLTIDVLTPNASTAEVPVLGTVTPTVVIVPRVAS